MSEEYDEAAADDHLLGDDLDDSSEGNHEKNGTEITEEDDLADESVVLGDDSSAADDTQYAGGGPGAEGEVDDDPEVQALKAQLKAMEEEGEQEAERLRQLESEAELSKTGAKVAGAPGAPIFLSPEEKKEVDARSIYVGNVDYSATAEELEQHFHGCGSVNRVTINCDKYTGHPKGFAYIEFTDPDGVNAAQALDESLFKGRQIKVVTKRTNVPGHSITNRGRGRGFPRARGAFRGYPAYSPHRGGPAYRSRSGYRGGFRARARYGNYYAPY